MNQRTFPTLQLAAAEEQRLRDAGFAVSHKPVRDGFRLRWQPARTGPVRLRLGPQARSYANGR